MRPNAFQLFPLQKHRFISRTDLSPAGPGVSSFHNTHSDCLTNSVSFVGALLVLAPFYAQGAGLWNGQDLIHVPTAWAAVQGSPAEATPNITNLGGVTDTDTDAILWRRHERPTDNIYSTPAGITFRSAINNAWGTFNFPIIADPNTTLGTPGDVNGWDVNVDSVEFNALLNAADAAYTALGRAGIGITTVNCGLFHDRLGNYVGIAGWGGCAEVTPGTCATPLDGIVMVADNRYFYPTVADRTWPPSPADPAGITQFVLNDPLDVLTGHEFGHALGLPHRTDPLALMNPGITDNNGDNAADNIALTTGEINTLRANARNVPGVVPRRGPTGGARPSGS